MNLLKLLFHHVTIIGGDESYQRAYDIAVDPPNIEKPDIFSLWPTNSSIMSNKPLKDGIANLLDANMIALLAKSARQHRSLLIGTTDLELAGFKSWNIALQANRLPTGEAITKLQEILLASTAFPPVEIDGHLYTDGGVAATVFLGVDARGIRWMAEQWQQKHPGIPFPKIRVWAIINAKLAIDERTVQPRYLDVAMRAINIMMAYDRIKALFTIGFMVNEMNNIEGINAEFRYIAIPEEAVIPKDLTEMGDKNVIHNLVEVGRELGGNPASWSKGTPMVYRIGDPGSQVRAAD